MPHDSRPSEGDAAASGHGRSHHDDEPAFGSQWWERHYQQGGTGSAGQPSPYVTGELAGMTPGTVLDAGCGTGADAIWLASQGWNVTAVDISPTAIDRARALAESEASHVVRHISWVTADLSEWEPPRQYDVVVSQYVHPGSPFVQFVTRLAGAVAPGGTLMVVGHDHSDSHSATHAPSDASTGSATVTDVLDPGLWKVEIAETRSWRVKRASSELTLIDTVVKAHRQVR